MGASRTFVHFQVDGDRVGLCLDEVTEISRVIRITPVPRSPEFVLGVANIRGRVVTLLDAQSLFGREEAPGAAGAKGHAVVLAPPREHLALFTRDRVDIGKGRESENASGIAGTADSRPGRAPLEGLVVMGDQVVHLIPAPALQAHCETRIMERYRRRA